MSATVMTIDNKTKSQNPVKIKENQAWKTAFYRLFNQVMAKK